MKITIAPDSFKGTLTASQAARRIRDGLGRALPRAKFVLVPMADGGEGTVRSVIDATGGRMARCFAGDPLGRRIRGFFGLTGDGTGAVIEMAAVSGLPLLAPGERDPLKTSTHGTGELMRKALDLGVKRIVLGIGGSATVDGGTGMARALGVRFLDSSGRQVPDGGGWLSRIERIDMSGLDPRLREVEILVACDVDNPLVGPRGAAAVYGPQKGATPDMVVKLDAGLRKLAGVIAADVGARIAKLPGAGAAGGLGGACVAFLGAELRRGVEIVADSVGLAEKIRGVDLVVTGEGRMDGQTRHGKTVAGVAAVARRLGVPVIAISGCVGPGASAVNDIGVSAYFSALEENVVEEQLPSRGPRMLAACAEQVGRLIATTSACGWGCRR